MEKVEEQSKVISTTTTTTSSPNTTQNDCYDDQDEHVINQNKQSQKILSASSSVLDLTESSSVTRSETSDKYLPQQVKLEKHVGLEFEQAINQDKPIDEQLAPVDEQLAPVDLTSVNATQIETASSLEYQTEPFNLKMDAVAR